MQIIHPGLEPIDLQIIGDKPQILPAAVQVADDGELVRFRPERVIKFYSDYGMRTVTLGALRFR